MNAAQFTRGRLEWLAPELGGAALHMVINSAAKTKRACEVLIGRTSGWPDGFWGEKATRICAVSSRCG